MFSSFRSTEKEKVLGEIPQHLYCLNLTVPVRLLVQQPRRPVL